MDLSFTGQVPAPLGLESVAASVEERAIRRPPGSLLGLLQSNGESLPHRDMMRRIPRDRIDGPREERLQPNGFHENTRFPVLAAAPPLR
jgi:hypothetical protein